MIRIDIANEQRAVAVDSGRLRQAAQSILAGEGFLKATVSVAIIDDAEIHSLNRQFLGHDYSTDVLSFVLEREPGFLEGEVVVSGETAKATAARFGWRAEDELLLYVIHGILHLVGYDDLEPDLQAEMRKRERHYLAQFELTPRYDES